MSHFLDRLTYFAQPGESFADGHGVTPKTAPGRTPTAPAGQHDKIVRSTHGTNCTGSCSWKIYVKGGIVTWETQQTDYPRTRPTAQPRAARLRARRELLLVPVQRQPREVPAGARPLLKHWRAARKATMDPVEAWAVIVEIREARVLPEACAAWAASCARAGTR
jgi:nitrate reductase / nitrite oxidoreductase, alpha subunit